jgi:hypothetical protein
MTREKLQIGVVKSVLKNIKNNQMKIEELINQMKQDITKITPEKLVLFIELWMRKADAEAIRRMIEDLKKISASKGE